MNESKYILTYCVSSFFLDLTFRLSSILGGFVRGIFLPNIGIYNERPAWLSNAHAKLDAAVAAAYGFPIDLADEQILDRLLALNQQRVVDEKSATKKHPTVSRAKTDEEFV